MGSFKYAYIYLTKNLITGKGYVGYHFTNLLYDDYYIGSGKYLHRAFKKHGRQNFINGILEFCNSENIKEREVFWIKELNTKSPNGYNLTDGGDGLIGYKHTKETRKKISSKSGWNRGLKNCYSPQTLQKMSNAHKGIGLGKVVSEDTKIKMSNVHKGKKFTEEHKQNISKFAKGKTWEERYGKKIADQMRKTRKIKKLKKI